MDADAKKLLEQLLDTLKGWNEDLKCARDDFKKSAEKLDKARKSFDENTKKFWVEYKLLITLTWIVALIIILNAFIPFKDFPDLFKTVFGP